MTMVNSMLMVALPLAVACFLLYQIVTYDNADENIYISILSYFLCGANFVIAFLAFTQFF